MMRVTRNRKLTNAPWPEGSIGGLGACRYPWLAS
jgi:hypothetical protein